MIHEKLRTLEPETLMNIRKDDSISYGHKQRSSTENENPKEFYHNRSSLETC